MKTSWSCPARDCAALDAEGAFSRLETSRDGLAPDEARWRRRILGENRLPSGPKTGFLKRLIEQLTSPLILILLAVAAIVPFVGDPNDALVILFVLAFNTTLGMIQEGRASHALEALKRDFSSTCTVRQGGKTIVIPTDDLTVGDVVILREGDRVPADGRLVEAVGLRIDESMLTGESLPVDKTADAITVRGAIPLADIKNAGFGQSLVVSGQGLLVVTAIGGETEVGRIARELRHEQTEPPLARKVRVLSRQIALAVGGFSALLFVFGVAAGRPPITLFATVMSLAVSIIPEGLPIVLTLVLARGVSHMAKKNAVVKKLNAVEGLGQVQVICTDKTGTLTSNALVVQHAAAGNAIYRIKGEGFRPQGEVYHGTRAVTYGASTELDALALGTRLFGDAALREDESGQWRAVGDPVDAALLCFGLRYGISENGWKVIEEIPFSYLEKRRLARWEKDGRRLAYMAGSPEAVFSHCDMRETEKDFFEATVSAFAKDGLRVIALAVREGNIPLADSGRWTIAGLVGMGDTLRPRVVESVRWCRDQGIRVVMITGDHPETALAIARSAGIAESASEVMNGPELEALDDEGLRAALANIRVFSRITPDHKLRLVDAYQKQGLLTAMTGDGVNDAPALHRADIGIAMGKGGTDVAREAAHLVLMDDNFATIVTAIQEGRATVSNVRRVIMYLFSTNLAEAGLITLTLVANLPLPLLPAQIIWINLVTDSFLDVSLGLEPRHGSSHPTSGALIDQRSITRMLLLGGTMVVGTFLVYVHALDRSLAYLQTITLTTLAAYQWLNAWNARSETRSLAEIPLLSNRYLIGATVIVVSLQLAAVYAPPMQNLLGTTRLTASDWGIVLAVATSIIMVDELWKKVRPMSEKKIVSG